jgi:predicted phage tail protein
MINIKYYPVRFGKECQEKDLDFSRDLTIKDYISQAGIDHKDLDVIVDGKVAKSLDHPIDNQSEIIVTPKIEGPIWPALVWLGHLIWAAALAHPFIAWGVILSTSFSVYSAVSAGRMPSFGSLGSGLDESSPTFGWEGIQTTQDVGVPVKIVGGRHRTGGNIINQFISTDGDKQYLNILIGVCEGPIVDITGIQVNGNPIENYSDIEIIKRLGTNDQEAVPGFENLHNIYNINTQLLKSSAHVYTTVDSDVEGFEIYLTLPAGIFQVASDGSIQAWDVTYQVEYKLHSAGSYTDLGTTTISGKSRSTVRRVFSKEGLAAGKYDIRITRTSDDSSLSPQMTGDLYLTSVDELKTDNLIYPNTALLGIKALATDQLSDSTPNFTFIVEDARLTFPAVLTGAGGSAVDWEDYYWDPVASLFKNISTGASLYWDGTTYTTGFCANPIWFMKDLLLNKRYGMGEYVETDNIDEDEMLEMAKYCEERVPDGEGGYEKRFRMDVVIDSASKAPDVLTQLTAVFRAFPFYSQNGFSFRIDKPESAVQMFGMGNIGKDSFQQSWKSKNEVFNVVEVTFMDQDLDYQQETISIEDEASLAAGDPRRPRSVRVFATKKSYAIREGRYALWVSKYINRTLSIRGQMDAIACQVGDVINVSHDVPQAGFSGNVEAGSTTTLVKLDRAVTVEVAKTFRLMVRFADNTLEEKTVSSAPGTYTEVAVSSAFGQAPAAFDKYSFGEVNKVVKPYRVVSIKRESGGDVGIAAIEYNASVNDDSAVAIPTSNYSSLSLAIPNVSNLSLTERLMQLGDGSIEDAIDVWFDKPYIPGNVRTIKKVRIYISEDNVSWAYRGETVGTHFPIVGDIADNVTYYIKAVTVTNDGVEGDMATSPSASISVVGKSAPPSDVGTFLVNRSRDRLLFGWTPVTDLDISGYEIRFGSSWESGGALVSNTKGSSYIELNFREGPDQHFWIKAIDTSGNFSTNATEAVITVEEIPFKNVISSYSEAPSWSATKVNTTRVTPGVLELSTGYLTGTYETAVRDVGYVASFKIGIEEIITVAGDRAWDSDPDAKFDDSISDRFSGSELAGAATFEIKTSEDNITWSAYAPWQAGDYYCRYFQIRMTMTRADLSQAAQCSQLDYYADLPDVDDMFDDEVTNASTGKAITFTKTFHEDPVVHIMILDGSGVYALITGLSTTGCTVKLYNTSGTAQTGNFRVHVHGV